MKQSVLMLGVAMMATVVLVGCDDIPATADKTQARQQETLMKEATAQTGMPAIKNFRERKLMKEILELRDQDGLSTYTYTFSELTGKRQFFCDSVGFPFPYATEYTSPQRPALATETHEAGNLALPQADPNGLFSPASAEGTWVMCLDPTSQKVRPVYVEPRIIVSPFKFGEDTTTR